MSVVLKVEGMSCQSCVQAIEGALEKIGAKAKVSLEEKTVTVDDSNVSIDKIKETIEDQGFDVV